MRSWNSEAVGHTFDKKLMMMDNVIFFFLLEIILVEKACRRATETVIGREKGGGVGWLVEQLLRVLRKMSAHGKEKQMTWIRRKLRNQVSCRAREAFRKSAFVSL